MGQALRRTNQEVVEAYKETGSVWQAAKLLGMAGQSVHERLVKIGYPLAGKAWSEAETEELRQLIANGFPLGEVAKRLGRTYTGVACRASRLEVRSEHKREKKLPRGAGYDKVTTKRRLGELQRFDGTATQFARSRGLPIESLVQSFQRHFPRDWDLYVSTHSGLPERFCGYCEGAFIPNSGRQEYCSRKCQGDAGRDRKYFGGKRRTAVGMEQGVCQLCGKKQRKGLSAHHVFGKENDPENESMVALCMGCHKAVGLLASRLFVDDATAWESLISLAWLRRHGHELHEMGGDTLGVCVEIEVVVDDEEAARAAEPEQMELVA